MVLSHDNFKDFFNEYKAMVLGISMRYVRCPDDAKDVLQETFISIYRNMHQYDPNKPIKPWIQRITINSALMYIRKTYRYVLIENEAEFFEESSQDEIDENLNEFSQEKLVQLLQNLPDGYRTVFNLYAIDGLNHKEIAEYLEISESTSRTQLLRARLMIQQQFKMINLQCYERA
jgi:RNA polymerase sigma factor (sigma-70 family)